MQPFAPIRRGLALRDVLTLIAISGVGLCALIPTLGAMRGDDRIARSMMNLNVIFQAHMTYAGDYDGRQLTYTPDDLTLILDYGSYPFSYASGGQHSAVPSYPLGFDCDGNYRTTRRGLFIQPWYYAGNCSLGNFRAWTGEAIHQYVNGKVYDPTFWAPKDPIPRQNYEQFQEWFQQDCAWPSGNVPYFFPTYCLSVSAQFSPRVLANDLVGQRRPLRISYGHRTPTISQARYPDLKTFLLEHWWLQNRPPEIEVPSFTSFFNSGQDSSPVTLFYDGQVRLMSTLEALVSDEYVRRSGQPSLVAERDPGCFGLARYWEHYSYNGEKTSSFHVMTADGILGRDTIFAIGDAGEPRDPE